MDGLYGSRLVRMMVICLLASQALIWPNTVSAQQQPLTPYEELEGLILLQVEDFQGPWRRQTNIGGFLGTGFVTSNANPEIADTAMRGQVMIRDPGAYQVWVRAFNGGQVSADNRKRAIQAAVNGQRLNITHDQPDGGWTWQQAGTVNLRRGVADLAVHDADIGWETADAMILTRRNELDGSGIERTLRAARMELLDPDVDGFVPHTMMHRYLVHEMEQAVRTWQQRWDSFTTVDELMAEQQRMREGLMDALGELPERTPLDARVTGTLQREAYVIEKVLFESQPGLYVTGNCFVPRTDRFQPPYPAVLVPSGHTFNGKAFRDYQAMGALLALNGMVAFVFDPLDQAERLQLTDQRGLWGVHAHNRLGAVSALVGRNAMTYMLWDGIRALDYLESRDDVDAERIGVTGNSGGGTQSAFFMVADERITVAGPNCWLTSLERLIHTIGPQDAEQHVFGQLAFGLDHAGFVVARAPMPVIIGAADNDFFDIGGTRDTFRRSQRWFEIYGAADAVALFENSAGWPAPPNLIQAV